MYPSIPQSLHLHMVDAVAHRSPERDPDGFIPEWHGYQPDPIGLWFVQRFSAVADRLGAARSRGGSRSRRVVVSEESGLPHADLAKEPGA